MKKRLAYTAMIALFLTACLSSPFLELVTSEEALQRIADHTPILSKAQKVQPLNPIEETIGDVTIILHWALLDPEMIAVGLTTHSASGRRYEIRDLHLTSATGATFEFKVGTGLVGSSKSLGIRLPKGESADILIFEMIDRPAITEPIDVELELTLEEFSVFKESVTWVRKKLTQNSDPSMPGTRTGPFQLMFTLPAKAEQ